MILPAFTQGIYGRLRQQAGADWQHYVAHPFLRQLADGTLPEPAFRRYLTQDYLFLIHFARSYALLVSKLRTLAEMRAAAASMIAILDELPLHVGYCREWGLDEATMARRNGSRGNRQLHPLRTGHRPLRRRPGSAGGAGPCVAATRKSASACCTIRRPGLTANPYASWIRNYGDKGYLNGVNNAIGLLETLWRQRGGEARFAELSAIFTTATRLEANFWQMGLNAVAERPA